VLSNPHFSPASPPFPELLLHISTNSRFGKNLVKPPKIWIPLELTEFKANIFFRYLSPQGVQFGILKIEGKKKTSASWKDDVPGHRFILRTSSFFLAAGGVTAASNYLRSLRNHGDLPITI
jgi:hypothetical protein